MFAEFFSGTDSFPGGRNVQFSTLVYNPATALFENPRQLTESARPVCRDIKITQGIPASVLVQTLNSQMWYHYRCECRSGALFLFESRIRQPGSTFGYDRTYLLLRFHPDAPATRVTYTLPPQNGANIHKLEMTVNARRVRSHTDMIPDERGAFKKFVGETRDVVVDVTQHDSELPGWDFALLEPPQKKSAVVLRGAGKKASAIHRIRRIRR